MVSRFLEDFTVAEIRGNELPEKIEVKENNASQNVYSISKLYTVTAIGILWDKGF